MPRSLKPCTKCGKENAYTEKGRRVCTTCRNEYQNKRRAAKGQNSVYHNRRRWRQGIMLWEYLKCHPCVDCGETNPNKLELDHVRGEKKQCVTEAATFKQMFEEIAKCEVRCGGCHLAVTQERINSRKHRYLSGQVDPDEYRLLTKSPLPEDWLKDIPNLSKEYLDNIDNLLN